MRHRRGPERGTMWVLELEEERKEEEKKRKRKPELGYRRGTSTEKNRRGEFRRG